MKNRKSKYSKKGFSKENIRKNNDVRVDNNKPPKIYDDIIEGRNPVLELLESGKDINKIFIQSGEKNGSINKIIAKAKEKRIVMVEVQKSKLDEI